MLEEASRQKVLHALVCEEQCSYREVACGSEWGACYRSFFLRWVDQVSAIQVGWLPAKVETLVARRLSSIAEIGSIRVSKDLTLNSVIHVPTLKCNLLSISKLIHNHNCVANFYSSLSLSRSIIMEDYWQCWSSSGAYFLEDMEYESQQAS